MSRFPSSRRRRWRTSGAYRKARAASRGLHRGRHARCRPPLDGRHRRPESVLARGGRGAADDPVRDGPHRLRIRWRLPGVHAMYGGTDFRWQQPIRLGDRIVGDSVLLDLVEKPSRFAKRAIQQIYATTSATSVTTSPASPTRGASARSAIRRASAPSTGPAEAASYTASRSTGSRAPTRLRRFAARSPNDGGRADRRSAAVHREGPADGHSVIAFIQGWGSLYIRAHGAAFDLVQRHPDSASRTRSACRSRPTRALGRGARRAVGVPGPYDYGPERVAWLVTS